MKDIIYGFATDALPYFLVGFLGGFAPTAFRWIERHVREHERIVNEKHMRGIK